MKLFTLVSALVSLSLTVQGAPVVEERATTPAQALKITLDSVQTSVNQSDAAITTAINDAKTNVTAATTIAVRVGANVEAMTQSFKNAVPVVVAAIQSAATDASGQAQALSQSELDLLTSSVVIIVQAITTISASIRFQVTNLVPSAAAAVKTEQDQLKAAIAPVVNPIMVFVSAVSKASAKAGVDITGTSNTYSQVILAIHNFYGGNGLPDMSFPGYVPLN